MRLPLLLAVVALPLLPSCGGDDDGSGSATATATAPAAAAPTRVTATDFAFDPAELSHEAGTVNLELVNEGSAPHALAIEGAGIDESTETVGGGEATTLEVELEEGQYEIYCPVGDHRDRGMAGTLTVGGGPATGGGEDDSAGGGAGY